MSALFERLFTQHRMVLLLAFMLAAIGAAMWQVMPRQEDPELANRYGMITVAFDGADPETLERLVVEPLEDALLEIEEIRYVQAEAMEGFSVIYLELEDAVDASETSEVWKDVEDAIERAEHEFPEGVGEPVLDRRIADLETVVLAVTGSDDLLALRQAALDLKDELITISAVSRVKVIGDPGDEIVVAYDQATAARIGLPRGVLTAQLQARNTVLPAGSVVSGDKRAALAPVTELEDLDDVARMPVRLPGGTTVPLGTIAAVTRGPLDPPLERMRFQGRPAVGLGIVADKSGNIVDFGNAVRERIDSVRADYAPLRIEEVAFQPARVEDRISELGSSLIVSMLIVAGIVFTFMGVRMGVVVTAIVPLVVLSSVAIYAIAGGVLHQMSIAAVVIALGMLVDNAIVIAEDVVRRLDEGEEPGAAARHAVRDLALPLLTATGTTVAAFVPMLLSEGAVGEFTRAIPVLVTLTLAMSYFYATLVTPVMGLWILRPRHTQGGPSAFDRMAAGIGRFAVRNHVLVLVVVTLAMIGIGSFADRVERNFFPQSDRNELVVELRLPDGTRIEALDTVARALEAELVGREDVTGVATFLGRSAPHFYYNIPAVPRVAHVAQVVVTTVRRAENAAVQAAIQDFARRELPGVQVIASELEQGPLVLAPIEVRLHGSSLDDLRVASERLVAALQRIPGTRMVRDRMSLGVPTLELEIDDAAAARHGVSRRDVALALLGHTRGLPVGVIRKDDEPVPIRVRSSEGEHTSIESLGGIEVPSAHGTQVPLAELVHSAPRFRPARYVRRNGKREAVVLANLEEGYTYAPVIEALQQRLPALDLPPSVRVHWGGPAEGAGDANTAMAAALPLGVLMLIGFLMIEFNSFRRTLIVLSTIPLAAVGVIPGLIYGKQPFGFMSMLGVIALAGVVVNNAIVLLDVVEQRRREGFRIPQALVESVRIRLRPILLTTGTTVAGLIPLAFSDTSLWPPLAWSMISGLLASTMLTLFYVPALYRVLIRP